MRQGKDDSIDPGHTQVRAILRVVGPLLLIIAAIIGFIGLADFFSTMGHLGQQPQKFHYIFIAMPLGFVGLALTSAGFAGAVARYQAQEIAPVGKDTFNYLAEGTQKGVATVAGAIAGGLRSAGTDVTAAAMKVRCSKCNALSDETARFCSSCGEPLAKSQPCSECGELNDLDARFCDACGHALASDK